MSFRKAEFVDTVEAALDKYGRSLREIIGKPFNRGWVAWDNGDNEWFADEAVVFEFGERRLEACFYKMSDFAITWDSVDVTHTPSWMGDWWGIDVSWRLNGHPALLEVLGKELKDVAIVSYEWQSTVVENRNFPERAGQKQTISLLHAIEFCFENTSLTLFNALDENGLKNNIQDTDQFKKWSVLDYTSQR